MCDTYEPPRVLPDGTVTALKPIPTNTRAACAEVRVLPGGWVHCRPSGSGNLGQERVLRALLERALSPAVQARMHARLSAVLTCGAPLLPRLPCTGDGEGQGGGALVWH